MSHTEGKWLYSFSTPKEQSEKWEGNVGGLCHVFVEADRIFGRPASKIVCDLLHWRDDKRNDEVLANAKLITAAPEMLKTLLMLKQLAGELPETVLKEVDRVLDIALK